MCESLVSSLKTIMPTAKFGKCYLPLEIFAPAKLKKITDSLLQMTQKINPAYVLV